MCQVGQLQCLKELHIHVYTYPNCGGPHEQAVSLRLMDPAYECDIKSTVYHNKKTLLKKKSVFVPAARDMV